MNKGIFILMVMFFDGSIIMGQQLNFSGTWILEQRISVSGNNYVNGMPSNIYIDHNADSIIIRKKTVDQNGKDTFYIESFPITGTISFVISSDIIKKIVLQWAAKEDQFTQIVNYENSKSKKVDRTITYSWKLTDKNLTLDRLDENRVTGEVWSMKGIYRRKAL
jgi:hypothetical protein